MGTETGDRQVETTYDTMSRAKVSNPSEKAERFNKIEANVELHAWGLDNPSHMEWTNDNRLLVAERTSEQIMDVTDGGSMRDADPFAYNVKGPASMIIMPPGDDRILAGESFTGEIKDVSGGGDASEMEPFAEDLEGPYSLVRVASEDGDRLFARVARGEQLVGVREVTGGGSAEDMDLVVDEIPVKPQFPGISEYQTEKSERPGTSFADCGNWLVDADANLVHTVGSLGQMAYTDVDGDTNTHTQHLAEDRVFAYGLHRLGGSKYNHHDGIIYATEPHNGSVVAIDPEETGDYRFDSRLVEGLSCPTCVRFSDDNEEMYVCGRGEGVVWRITDFRP